MKAGSVLVIALVVIAAVAMFSGVIEGIFPAQQSSKLAQTFVSPDGTVDIFPITTLGSLKNQKQKLDVLVATADIVGKEYEDKIGTAQKTYDKFIGTIDNPGLFGAAIAALLSGYLTKLYKDKTLYSEGEYKEALATPVKEG